MDGLWFVSYITLWFVVAFEGLILMVALRQIGVLHMRLLPRSALAVEVGPKVGEKVPEVIREDLDGQLVTIGAETKHDTCNNGSPPHPDDRPNNCPGSHPYMRCLISVSIGNC